MRTERWRSMRPSLSTVGSTLASPPTTWVSRRITSSWRLKVGARCHPSESPRCLVLTTRPFLSTSEPTRILKQPEYKVVQRGMSAAFECKVKHDPTLIPIMTWLKDSGELPDDERYRATQGGPEGDHTEYSSNTVMRLGLWLMQTL